MLQDRLLSTYMPFSTLPIMSSNDELPGSKWNSGLLLQGKWLSDVFYPEKAESDWNYV